MGKPIVSRRGYALGAEIAGVDASQTLDDETVAAIRTALLDHLVVYLPGQRLSPRELRDFSARFGELDVYNGGSLPRMSDLPEVLVRTSKPIVVEGTQVRKSPPGDRWHSDYSHSDRPATFSLLWGAELPDIGGDTLFSNMYMGYETLSEGMKRLVEGLQGVHDITASTNYATGDPEQRARIVAQRPPVVHPIVRVHAETGRKALFISEFVRKFVGMSEEETKPLRDFLIAHATRYEFVYRHRWTPNDLVIWDNRSSMHLAVQDYDQEQLRRMVRCSLIDAPVGRLYSEVEREAVAASA